MAAAGSKTRAVFSRSYNGSGTNTMDFVTIANQGNALDFGDSASTGHSPAGCGDSTRGLFGGGAPGINYLEFFTFDSTGNAQDFGDLYSRRDMGACSSSTRGIFAGGGDSATDTMQYVTIQSLGDGVDFGNLAASVMGTTGCSSSTRGIFAQGSSSPYPGSNTIQFVTISTTGNTTDFGDLVSNQEARYNVGSCTDCVRGIFAGGTHSGGRTNVIGAVNLASEGNAIKFGDLTDNKRFYGGTSMDRDWETICA